MTDATPTNIGKYVIEGVIGEGAMGTVYRAKDSVIGRTVAIKVMNAAIARDENHRQRFLREAQAAGSLQHPNVVTIFDLGEIEGHLFIAMEFLRGVDLEKLMAGTDTLKLQSKLDIIVDVLMGLSYAHSNGIVHRDIKPANIRVGEDGKAKIMDFGVAHLASSDMTRTGLVVGTPSYMAPEQVTGGKTVPGTDIFAVGAVLYHLLTGIKPFEGPTLQSLFYRIVTDMPRPLDEVRPGLPPALNAIIQKAMAKEPSDRYASALEMSNAIISVRAGLSGNPYASTASLTASAVSIEEKFTPPAVPVATGTATVPPASATMAAGFPWKPVGATAAAAVLLFAGWNFILKEPDSSEVATVAPSAIPAPIGVETAPINIPAPAESTVTSPAVVAEKAPETVEKAETKPPEKTQAQIRRERAAAAARLKEEQQKAARLKEAQKRAASQAARSQPTEQKRTVLPPAPTVAAVVQPPRDTQPRAVTVAPAPLPAPPPPPPPAPARSAELQAAAAREGINAAVGAYARAIESRDLDAVRRAYPGITADQARGFQQFFSASRSINVTFRVTDVEASGTSADARLTGTYVYVTNEGKTERQPVSFGASLRYDGANWQLRSVR